MARSRSGTHDGPRSRTAALDGSAPWYVAPRWALELFTGEGRRRCGCWPS